MIRQSLFVTAVLAASFASGMTFGQAASSRAATAPETAKEARLAPAAAATPSLPDPLAAGWQGEKVCERLHEDPGLRILRCTFAPGVGHERHFHPPHHGYAIAGGRMRITDEAGTREVDSPAGNSWTSAGVAWHEVVNVGETTAVYLVIETR